MDNENSASLQEDEFNIDIIQVLKNFLIVLVHNYWYVIIFAAVFAAALGLRAYISYSPSYETKAVLSVNAGKTSVTDIQTYSSYYDTAATKQVVKTFPAILATDAMTDLICQDLHSTYVNGTISAKIVADNTNLFVLKVRSNSPDDAYNILISVLNNYPLVASLVTGDTSIYVVEEPQVPTEPVNKMNWTNSALKGGLMGAGAVIIVMMLIALSIRTINSTDDLKKVVNLDCFGTVPVYTPKKRTKKAERILLTDPNISDAFVESIRTIRTRIMHYCQNNDTKVILITSTVPGEGKSTISSNIAVSLAQSGYKVCLVDADLRVQTLRSFFGLNRNTKGLSDALSAENPFIQGFITDVGIENLKIISGQSTSTPFSLMRSKKISDIFDKLRDTFDYVIVDTPPSGFLADADSFIRYSDGVLYVIKSDYASKSQIINNLQTLSESGANIMGYIIGGVAPHGGNYGYSRYGYDYKKYGYDGYGYSKEKSVEQNDTPDEEIVQPEVPIEKPVIPVIEDDPAAEIPFEVFAGEDFDEFQIPAPDEDPKPESEPKPEHKPKSKHKKR